MTIKYCDYVNGSDATGDGTAGNPYKTIDKASTGMSGGDEVRVAKSPDDTVLTGTLTFTINSKTVSGSETNFSDELANGDYIKGNDGKYYEVVSIDSATSLTLLEVYGGATASGVTSYKKGVTDTGAASSSTAVIQQLLSSGTSKASQLLVSGGWDLSTETQTGRTTFRQMHATFANRYGYGLYNYSKKFVKISKIDFLRYYYGIYLGATALYELNDVFCGGAGNYGIYGIQSNFNTFTDVTLVNNTYHGIRIEYCMNCVFNSLYSGSNSGQGIYVGLASFDNVFYNPITRYNAGGYGIYLYYSANNYFYNQVSDGHSAAIILSGSSSNFAYNPSFYSDVYYCSTYTGYYNPRLYTTKYGGIQDYDIIFADYMYIRKQTTTRHTDSGYAWRISMSNTVRSVDYPACFPIAKIACVANQQVTFTAYMKKSNTGVGGKIMCRKNQLDGITSDVEATLADNTDWQQLTLQFTPTVSGVVEITALGWCITGTGDVYVDDVNCSQS